MNWLSAFLILVVDLNLLILDVLNLSHLVWNLVVVGPRIVLVVNQISDRTRLSRNSMCIDSEATIRIQ